MNLRNMFTIINILSDPTVKIPKYLVRYIIEFAWFTWILVNGDGRSSIIFMYNPQFNLSYTAKKLKFENDIFPFQVLVLFLDRTYMENHFLGSPIQTSNLSWKDKDWFQLGFNDFKVLGPEVTVIFNKNRIKHRETMPLSPPLHMPKVSLSHEIERELCNQCVIGKISLDDVIIYVKIFLALTNLQMKYRTNTIH